MEKRMKVIMGSRKTQNAGWFIAGASSVILVKKVTKIIAKLIADDIQAVDIDDYDEDDEDEEEMDLFEHDDDK